MSLAQKTIKGVVWSSIERFSGQGAQFVLGIILARILSPSDYGLIGMLAIFLAVSDSFVQSGFAIALVQKKDRDDLDFSTTFYFNVFVSIIFYLLLFISAPYIADFFNQPILESLTRVIGLSIVINGFAVVQRAKFTINIDFKTQTKASLSSIIISGLLGIYLAYHGFGVWSLVYQSLLRIAIEVAMLWYISKWVPSGGFSFDRFKRLFGFGYKLLLSGLINTIFGNIYTIIIGKFFSASSLGYYTRAGQLSDFPSTNISFILGRVTFPALSELQDDNEKLSSAYKKIILKTALLVFPLMVGLAALADPFVITILSEKWRGSIIMLQLLCLYGMWTPIHAINLNILNVKGRSDLFLKLEVIKKTFSITAIFITVPLGINAMLIGFIVLTYIALVINLYYSKRIINYGFWQQIRDLLPILLLSFAMGALIYFTIPMFDSNIIKLLAGFVEGLVFYLGIAWFFNIGGIREVQDYINFKRT